MNDGKVDMSLQIVFGVMLAIIDQNICRFLNSVIHGESINSEILQFCFVMMLFIGV